MTAVIFCFIAAWNEYVIALTLINTTENQPLTLGVTSFIGLNETEWQYLFAASLIAIVPVVILFGLIERYLISGLTAGKHQVAMRQSDRLDTILDAPVRARARWR